MAAWAAGTGLEQCVKLFAANVLICVCAESWTASFRSPTVLVGGRNAGAPAISHQGWGWLGTREAVDGFVDILLHFFTVRLLRL